MTFLPPVLTGILCVISMFADNANRIGWNQLLVPLAYGILVGLFFWFIFWLNPPTNKSASLISTIFTFCFLVFYAITPWASLVLVVVALVVGIKFNLAKVTKPLTVMLALAITVSTGMALANTNWGSNKVEASVVTQTERRLPNIYFIIPDRMPSIEAMTESGIDSTEFVARLRADGFYVKENQLSHDAYTPTTEKATTTRTMRYLASVLNDGKEIYLNTPYKEIISLIRNPAIIQEVHKLGYQYHHIGSWFTETAESPNADYNHVYEGRSFFEWFYSKEFTVAVWDRSIMRGINLMSKSGMAEISVKRYYSQFFDIWDTANLETQHFVFAHIILPHEPYVFDANGVPQENKNLTETELYYQQIQGTMHLLVTIVQTIDKTDPNSIIIIQSDEGMAYSKPAELNYALSDTQWNGVLTAWRIPGADEVELAQLKHTEILKYLVEWLK